jgi:hypothetical protein
MPIKQQFSGNRKGFWGERRTNFYVEFASGTAHPSVVVSLLAPAFYGAVCSEPEVEHGTRTCGGYSNGTGRSPSGSRIIPQTGQAMLFVY